MQSDKAAVASHELHNANAIGEAGCFDFCRLNGSLRGLHRRLETETFVDDRDVVVDRLWDRSHSDRDATLARLLCDFGSAPQRTVTTDDVYLIHTTRHEGAS